MKRNGSQPRAEMQTELARIDKALGNGRETLGPRAHSAQVIEWACGPDEAELAELFTERLDGARY
jgi:hypothetical protein